ncbi:30S ribosomal protein S5 [Candidatus Saccharibacteria bacterium]|nr:30S ribosomal protein S5 [Candidatus Saccharibacteria bacterium]NIV03756.1 30S ribosomal protein S5 [Calditrichia bacterium]NIS38273.1 30S ribosomal protein S5 [Candidatus Saccharibacteria bacterium]NIV72053.1 30S ribosomal protein S5 [Calditrichia bacterium]NIV98901.1 30S ribosomal protein S5 [Candidatus Saccharibacteria bacterium]
MTDKEDNKKEPKEEVKEEKKPEDNKSAKGGSQPKADAPRENAPGGEEPKEKVEEPKKEETKKPGEGKEEKKSFDKRGPRKDRGRRGFDKRRGGRGRGPEEREFDQKTLDIARVTRVTKGGKRMRFRSLVVLGNRKGRVGYGIAKGADVAISVSKASSRAKKKMIDVPLKNDTIPHEVKAKYAAARVLLKPAVRGSGIKAGGAVRAVLEVAGIPNITGKIMGSKNKINNVKATFKALESLVKVEGEKKQEKKPAKPEKKDKEAKKTSVKK